MIFIGLILGTFLALIAIVSQLEINRLKKEVDTMEYIMEIKDNQILEMEDSIRKLAKLVDK